LAESLWVALALPLLSHFVAILGYPKIAGKLQGLLEMPLRVSAIVAIIIYGTLRHFAIERYFITSNHYHIRLSKYAGFEYCMGLLSQPEFKPLFDIQKLLHGVSTKPDSMASKRPFMG
jgi:hypothetical protein